VNHNFVGDDGLLACFDIGFDGFMLVDPEFPPLSTVVNYPISSGLFFYLLLHVRYLCCLGALVGPQKPAPVLLDLVGPDLSYVGELNELALLHLGIKHYFRVCGHCVELLG